MSKIIVFSGHGAWYPSDGYTKLPAKCSMKFYTMNAKLLSDGLGRDIDRGIVSGLQPDQEAGEFKIVPNMTLFPPINLNLRCPPNPATWRILYVDNPVPVDNKNIQVRMQYYYDEYANLRYNYSTLEQLFDYLAPAIRNSDSVTFLWAACRDLVLHKTERGKKIGMNSDQR